MGIKSKELENVELTMNKAKRGRKSKKELLTALNVETLVKKIDTKKINQPENTINLNISEIVTTAQEDNNNIYDSVLIDNELTKPEEISVLKKRGRKPKGGKIITQFSSTIPQKEDKPNVILHLKCSMKDLQINTPNNTFMESYNFSGTKNDLNYELIKNENINSINVVNDKNSTLDSDCDDYDEESVGKDFNKEIYKKLKQLEHNLHINNVNNKRSACFWDTCEFDNPPIYIPKHFINGTYNVYGCFCSPECGVAHLMNENIDSSTKFERYHLFNHIYTKIYDYKKKH